MDPERIDLSLLDPARDPVRWERFVGETVRRALPPLVSPLLTALVARRGVLAVLVVAAVLAWLPVWTRARSVDVEAVDPAVQLADWAGRGTLPEASTFSEALGGTAR